MASILIIEDDSAISHVYGLVLSKKGHQVWIAEEANKGIEMAVSNKPDIILLDMLMPGVSGLDLLRKLNIKQNLPDTKLIVMSNIESPKVVEEAKALGAVKYLLKIDFTPYEIDKVIKDLL